MSRESQKPLFVNTDRVETQALMLSKTLGYFSVDFTFCCLEWNNGMNSLTQVPKESVLNRSLTESFPTFRNSDLYQLLSDFFNLSKKEELDFTGQLFWESAGTLINYTIIPIFEIDGSINTCHIICQKNIFRQPATLDINKNKTIQSIQPNTEPYFNIFEKLAIPSLFSRYGIIQHSNKALLELIGFTQEDLIGKNVLDFVHPEQMEELSTIIASRYQGKEINSPLIYDIKKQDSGYITCELEVSFIELIDGLASVVSLHDVSEKIKIQKALIESETKLRHTFESTFVGIIYVNNKGYINEANDRFLEIIGHSREEFNNKKIHWEDLTPPDYLEHDYEIMPQLLNQGYINPYEKAFYKKDGNQVPILVTCSLLNGGGKNFAVTFIIDLTEIKESKAETIKVTNELSTFLYMASHDLKGPLASVIGVTNLALEEIKDQKALYYFNLINDCTNKLDKSLLNFMKIIKIKNKIFEKDLIDFNAIIKETTSDYRHMIDKGDLLITTEISPLIPYYSDEDVIKTIFHNLIENAVKYAPKIRQTKIQITISQELNELCIHIEDNGKGISEAIIDKIFNIFFRGDHSSKGSGMGLFIVKSVAENLNGNVKVYNKQEGGVAFDVRLPISH